MTPIPRIPACGFPAPGSSIFGLQHRLGLHFPKGNSDPRSLYRHDLLEPIEHFPSYLSLATSPQPHFLRFATNHEVSFLVTGAVVSNTQKIDCFRPLLLSVCKPPKLHQPRFVRLKTQAKLTQSFWQHIQETFCITSMLKAHHKIINVSDQPGFPF